MYKRTLTVILVITIFSSLFCTSISSLGNFGNGDVTIKIMTSDKEEIRVEKGKDIVFPVEIFDIKDGVITSEEQVEWKDSHGAVVCHGNVLKVPAAALQGKFAASFSVTATNSSGETVSKIFDFAIGETDDFTLLFVFAGMGMIAFVVVLYSVVRSKRGKY